MQAKKKTLLCVVGAFLCLLTASLAGGYATTLVMNGLLNGGPPGIGIYLLGIVLPLLGLAGAVKCLFVLFPRNRGRKALQLVAVVGIWLLFETAYYFAAQYVPGLIYNAISGSILYAKIAMGFVLPLLKLPVYALLLCMLGQVLATGRIFARYGGKRYALCLIGALIVHGAVLACSMFGAVGAAGILQYVLAALLVISAILFNFRGGQQNEAMA